MTDPVKSIDHKALFVSGLSESVEFIDLQKHFEPFGKIVLARVLKDAKTGLSRRIGYVNFESDAVAAAALQATNKRPGPLSDEPITVKFAEKDPTYKAIETTRVFIRYIPIEVTVEQIREAFSRYGAVDEVTVDADHTRPQRKGPALWSYAYVHYASSREANLAVANAAKDIQWGPKPLTVKPAEGDETKRLRAAHRLSAFSTPTPLITVGVPPRTTTPLSSPAQAASAGRSLTESSFALPPNVVPLAQPSPLASAHHHHHHHHAGVPMSPGAPMQPAVFALPPQPHFAYALPPHSYHQHHSAAPPPFSNAYIHHSHHHMAHHPHSLATATPMMTFVPTSHTPSQDPSAVGMGHTYYMMPPPHHDPAQQQLQQQQQQQQQQGGGAYQVYPVPWPTHAMPPPPPPNSYLLQSPQLPTSPPTAPSHHY